MEFNKASHEAWKKFLNNQDNHGHVNRALIAVNVEEHVQLCMASSEEMVKRIKDDLLEGFSPKCILEVGSSAGLNCYALHAAFPYAMVIGLEPENEAILVARSMQDDNSSRLKFTQGAGEEIPLDDGSVDLIICHTVIEHVSDVSEVICEFSRVLSQDGFIHLEAPNYLWPYEPHLAIWTVPMFGKAFVKFTAVLQGKRGSIFFLNHLQFVTPCWLEMLYKKNGLVWENRVEKKLLAAVDGTADIKKYRTISKLIALLGKLGIAKLIVAVVVKLGIYPSVLYTLHKTSEK